MLQAGITGNIGSGKTTVSQLFELLGVPVYYADLESRKLLAENQKVVKAVKTIFGERAYIKDGKPDRKYIAEIVFKDKSKLQSLEGILHPIVQEHYRQWAQMQSAPYVLKEAALLLESGSYKELDKLIVVTAPEEVRICRVCNRDKMTVEQVTDRIRNQWTEERKTALADFIIVNDDRIAVLPQVMQIHKALAEG